MTFNREAWLQKVTTQLRAFYKTKGVIVPPVHISVGPTGSTVVGVCHSKSASKDSKNQIFISPKITDSLEVVSIVCHELVHASLDCKGGHGKDYQEIAKKVGLISPWTQSNVGDMLESKIKNIIASIGEYNHPKLIPTAQSSAGSRLLKVYCSECGYIVRVTRKWLDLGAPRCGSCDKIMEEE